MREPSFWWPCLPCGPWRFRGRPEVTSPCRPRDACLALSTIPDDALQRVLMAASAVTLARLASASRSFAPHLGDLLQARGLPEGTPLWAVQAVEASVLDFEWGGTDRTASGDDGWRTDFGPTGLQPGCRYIWELELLRYEGLFGLGVAEGEMQDNAFVGSSSKGAGTSSWGWELCPRTGRLEAVAACFSPQETGALTYLSMPLLRPGLGRRVVLGLHLDRCLERPRLQLFARIWEDQAPAECWSWHLLDTLILPGQGDASREALRPAVSVNIGATIRILSPGDFAGAIN